MSGTHTHPPTWGTTVAIASGAAFIVIMLYLVYLGALA